MIVILVRGRFLSLFAIRFKMKTGSGCGFHPEWLIRWIIAADLSYGNMETSEEGHMDAKGNNKNAIYRMPVGSATLRVSSIQTSAESPEHIGGGVLFRKTTPDSPRTDDKLNTYPEPLKQR
jgi:hypothetical protein